MIGLVLALTALAKPAFADVLEVGEGGMMWVSGGPEGQAGASPHSVAEPDPVTFVGPSAGPDRWRDRVAVLSGKYDLSPVLLEAVVWQESRWREGAVSPAGARGLAQLMPGTARMLGVDADDPSSNLEGGARYLRAQLDAFGGDLERALAAYNAGPGRVRAAGGVPAIRETQAYVRSILGRLAAPVSR